jgi:hypothetical protein
MTFDDDVLDRLAPALPWEPDWADVLGRAGRPDRSRWLRPQGKRRLVLALAALAVVLIPIVAVGAANDWWFLRFGNAPTPAGTPVVVKHGTWYGRAWELVAYASTTGDICFGVMPPGSEAGGEVGALGCAPFVGIPHPSGRKAAAEMTVTYLSGGGGDGLHGYIAGPVIDAASQVEIHLAGGQVLRLPTFAAPPSVGHVRFYAAPLPAGVSLPRVGPGSLQPLVTSVAGLDSDGNVVACLAPATAIDGVSPLSACG